MRDVDGNETSTGTRRRRRRAAGVGRRRRLPRRGNPVHSRRPLRREVAGWCGMWRDFCTRLPLRAPGLHDNATSPVTESPARAARPLCTPRPASPACPAPGLGQRTPTPPGARRGRGPAQGTSVNTTTGPASHGETGPVMMPARAANPKTGRPESRQARGLQARRTPASSRRLRPPTRRAVTRRTPTRRPLTRRAQAGGCSVIRAHLPCRREGRRRCRWAWSTGRTSRSPRCSR